MSDLIRYDDPVVYNDQDLLYDGEPTPDILLVVGHRRLEHLLTEARWSITDQVEERSAARFLLLDDALDLAIERGAPVRFYADGQLLFAGEADTPVEQPANPSRLWWDLACVDWHVVCDRRTVARGYEHTSAGAIVTDIIDTVLASDGIHAATVIDGPDVAEAQFNYVSATAALDRLAAEAGFTWWIDARRGLHFQPYSLDTAPWQLDDPDLVTGQRVVNRNPEHRTRQILRGGRAETLEQTERYLVDGVQSTVVVGFPIAREIQLFEDDVAQDVGVKGIGEESARWLWARGSAEITLADGETPPAAGVEVKVVYKGLFDLVMIATDEAERIRMANLSGGSGLIEHVITDRDVTTLDSAAEHTARRLAKYARPARELTFTTHRRGLAPGQLLHVDLPQHRLAGDMLVSQVVTRAIGAGLRYYDVTVLDGPITGSWTRFFARLADTTDPLAFRENISENETLVVLEQTTEQTGWSELQAEAVFQCDVVGNETDQIVLYPTSDDTYDDQVAYDVGRAYDGDIAGGRPVVC